MDARDDATCLQCLLERVARKAWKQPAERLHRISNGIDVAAYARKPYARALPCFKRLPGHVVVGTVAGLREVKDLPMLVRALTYRNESLAIDVHKAISAGAEGVVQVHPEIARAANGS